MSSIPKIGVAGHYRDPLILRFDGAPGFLPRAHKFYETRLFSEWNPSADEGALRRAFNWAFGGERLSLARILTVQQRTIAQPTSSGFENVDLPFSNVVLMLPQRSKEPSQEAIDYADLVGSALTAAMENAWSRYVDPMLGSRARAFPIQMDMPASCLLFMGEGVFAPRPGERPVGWIRVLTESGTAKAPLLPDGEPGGLYRGQTQVAFSGDWRISPAACADIADLPGAFLVRSSRVKDGAPKCGVSFHNLQDENVASPLIKEIVPAWGSEGVGDAAYKVTLVHAGVSSELQIEVCIDDRPSRLLARKPSGICFAIVGVVEPREDARRPVRRWWFDVDRDRGGLLCSSAMTPARKSIVCRGNSIEIWDWARPGARSRFKEFRWQRATRGADEIKVVTSDRPLGWLRAPPLDQPIAFVPSSRNEVYALDWLDFAGAVETGEGAAVRWAALRGERADTASSSDREDVMPGLQQDGGDHEFWVAPQGQWSFSLGSDQPLLPGARFLVAGLVLQCVE